MTEENRSHGEIQSKTVLIKDDDGVNDMLSALNVGREKLEKKKRRKEIKEKIKTALIIVMGIVIAVGVIYIVMQ